MSVSGSARCHIKPAYIIINSKDISPDENVNITIFLCVGNNNYNNQTNVTRSELIWKKKVELRPKKSDPPKCQCQWPNEPFLALEVPVSEFSHTSTAKFYYRIIIFGNFPHTLGMSGCVENCQTVQKLHLVVCGNVQLFF